MSSPAEILVQTGSESASSIDPEAPPRKPKRVLHFSDGTLEEYSDDEEFHDPADAKRVRDIKPCSATLPAKSPEHMRWGEYLLHLTMTFGVRSLNACDYLGEKFAWFLGITTPKYGYAIDERDSQKREEEREDERENQARAKRNAVEPKEMNDFNAETATSDATSARNLNSDMDILSSENEKLTL